MDYSANVARISASQRKIAERNFTGTEPAAEFVNRPDHPYWSARFDNVYLPALVQLTSPEVAARIVEALPVGLSLMARCAQIQREIKARGGH